MPKLTPSLQESRHKANLTLQILLYFNVYISVFWLIFILNYAIEYFYELQKIDVVLTTASTIATIPAEVARLYLGYSGNLKGRISDLAGFWILSALIQFPISIYQAATIDPFAIFYLHYIEILFILLEIIVSGLALHKLSRYYAQEYRTKFLCEMKNR